MIFIDIKHNTLEHMRVCICLCVYCTRYGKTVLLVTVLGIYPVPELPQVMSQLFCRPTKANQRQKRQMKMIHEEQ